MERANTARHYALMNQRRIVSRPVAENPFVAVPQSVIMGLRWFFAAYLTFVLFFCTLYNVDRGAQVFLLLAGAAAQITAVFFPLLIYRHGSFGFGHPLIVLSIFGVANLVLRQTKLLIIGLNEHVAVQSSAHDVSRIFACANLLSAAALFSLYFGYFRGIGPPIPRLNLVTTVKARFYVVMYFGVAIALLGTIFFAQVSGGWGGLISNLGVGTLSRYHAAEVRGLGQYSILLHFGSAAALLWLAADSKALRNMLFWPVGITGLITPFLLAGRRSALLYTLFMMLIVWAIRGRRAPFVRVGLLLFPALVFFGMVNDFRLANFNFSGGVNMDFVKDFSMRSAVSSSVDELESRSGQGSAIIPILARVPGEVPLLWGEGYLGYLNLFIPRQLWPEKPQGMAMRSGVTFFGVNWGMPPGAVGEAFWNFHIPGVLVIFYLSGIMLRFFGGMMVHEGRNAFVIVLYVTSIFLLFPPTNERFVSWVFAILPVIVMAVLSGCLCRERRVNAKIGL